MIYTSNKEEVIFASKNSTAIDALSKILRHENIAYNIGFSCDGTTIHCNKKKQKTIETRIKQWEQSIRQIAQALADK